MSASVTLAAALRAVGFLEPPWRFRSSSLSLGRGDLPAVRGTSGGSALLDSRLQALSDNWATANSATKATRRNPAEKDRKSEQFGQIFIHYGSYIRSSWIFRWEDVAERAFLPETLSLP